MELLIKRGPKLLGERPPGGSLICQPSLAIISRQATQSKVSLTGRYRCSSTDHGGGKRRAGVALFFLRREEMFTMGSLFPRFTSAGMGKTHHAYFRLPRLSDRLAFGTSADGDHCGRHGCSSCSTRWNAITPRRRGRGFTEYLGLAFSFTRKPHPF